MSADSPRRTSGSATRGVMAVPAVIPPQVVSDRSILDSAIGFINEVTLAHQPSLDPKDTITWARFETTADISDPRFGDDWELEGNVAPPLLLILGYGLGVQVWSIPANGEAVEVLSWRHGIVSALRVLPTPLSNVADEDKGRTNEPIDVFSEKRPLIALVDGSSASGSQPQFCAVNFISLKTGAQVKTIKFKNPVIDILANRSSVIITFHERIAVFDARTLEDRLSITTCYPSPGINPNPVALGARWLAYAENKLLHTKRSGGGCDGDGVASYTATVLNASKSLVKGLRELGEQVAAGLTGNSGSAGNSKSTSFDSGSGLDTKQAGIVSIIDIKNPLKDYSPTSGVAASSKQNAGTDMTIAHFIAHSEALVAMEFDNSGMLLVTADRRGHDFHVFRIQPNPVGSSVAAVHHLYILHRGDTSAKVQNITLTLDSRWVAVSTLRGTTHVFPITPYGGTMGVRTHTSLHVVNKLSRFHRSAGLSGEGRSNSPISHSESTTFTQSLQPYHNSTLPPFPRPTVVLPLAQLRQPFSLGSPPGSATLTGVKSVAGSSSSGSQRQRLSSLSDDSGKPLSVCAIFAKSRSWLLDPPNVTREAPHRMQRKAVDSLFVMAGHGALIQYDLGTKLASNIAKEKICDDTPIELEVEAKAQWNLGRRKEGSLEIMPPLSPSNWLIKNRNSCMLSDSTRHYDDTDERNESWLAQVEIITHAGPHRRLWMGPQFVFKTYNTPSGSNLNHVDSEAVEIGTVKPSSATEKLDQSSPLNMPLNAAGRSSAVPVLIESGSYSSIEQSPKLMDRFRHDHLDSDYSVAHGDSRLKEDLADAMRESPSTAASSKDAGGHVYESGGSNDNVAFYDALTAEDDQVDKYGRSASAAVLANALPNIHSYDKSLSHESLDLTKTKKPKASIEKIVNPLGTVTTVTSGLTGEIKNDILDEVVSQLAAEDTIIHENCDESLFRPVVAIFCDEKTLRQNKEEAQRNNKDFQPPEIISNKLVVPVIAKEINDELSKREKEKISTNMSKVAVAKMKANEKTSFEEHAFLNKKSKDNKRTIYTKGNIRPNIQDEGNDSQKNKSVVLKPENEQDPQLININEKKKTGCSKNTASSKESSTDINMKEKLKPKKDLNIQEKKLSAEQKRTINFETDVSTPQKIQPKIDSKKQIKHESQDFFDSKESDLNVKDILAKIESIESNYKSKNLSSNPKDKEQKSIRRDTITVSNTENTVEENNTTTTADIILSASIPSHVDDKDLTKTKMDNDNLKNIFESNNSNATQNTFKTFTAVKEKVKKPKHSIKTNKLETVDKISKQFNGQQLDDQQLDEVEKSGKNVNDKGDGALTTNPFFECDKKEDDIKSESNVFDDILITKFNAQHVSIDSNKDLDKFQPSTSRQKKDNFLDKSNDMEILSNQDWIELKKSDKESEKETDVAVNRELDLEINKNQILDGIDLKEIKSVSESVSQQNEYKDKSHTTKSDDKMIKKKKCNEQQQFSDSIKQTEEKCENNIQTNKLAGEINKTTKKSIHQNKKVKSFEKECKPEKIQTENDLNIGEEIKIEQVLQTEEIKNAKSQFKNETIASELLTLDADKKNLPKKVTPSTMQQDRTIEIKTKSSLTHEIKCANNDRKIKELSEIKPGIITVANEISNDISTLPNLDLCKKKLKDIPKSEIKKAVSLLKKVNVEKNEIIKEGKVKSKSETELFEKTLDACGKSNKTVKKMPSETLPLASAWKMLNSADVQNKSLCEINSESNEFPLLGTVTKINNSNKLLPEFPTPADIKKYKTFDEFAVFKSLDPLPPLPALEPIQFMEENKSSSSKDISLITFESPVLESPLPLQRKIPHASYEFVQQNLIVALCGSLHYENEHPDKTELSPTFSSNHSSTAFEDTSLADYKSLTENEDLYMSLDQSPQDTNTCTINNNTNTNININTNASSEKCSPSTNSSGSEEIVIVEEKKMTKKQKRKKQQQQQQQHQQQLKEFVDQKEHNQDQEIDDEELRPLIAMTDSQIDQTTNISNKILTASTVSHAKNQSSAIHQPLMHSTTTDSEGPLPATTSDENVFSIPVPIVHNPHKIKTKKLEHKINLIAAIEAATSSSTSSAEESGVEIGSRSSTYDNGESLISVANSISTSAIPLSIITTPQITVGALKKKTKRRKR